MISTDGLNMLPFHQYLDLEIVKTSRYDLHEAAGTGSVAKRSVLKNIANFI